MASTNERVSITTRIKRSIERHAPSDEKYARADIETVIDDVVREGYDREDVLEEYDRLIRYGELYEVSDETVGVV